MKNSIVDPIDEKYSEIIKNFKDGKQNIPKFSLGNSKSLKLFVTDPGPSKMPEAPGTPKLQALRQRPGLESVEKLTMPRTNSVVMRDRSESPHGGMRRVNLENINC